MGARSRKRGRTTQGQRTAPEPAAAPPRRETRAEAARRTSWVPGQPDSVGRGAPAPPSPRAAKTEARNEEIRRNLEPLEPGERPQWVTYAALFSAALGVLNVGLYAAGERTSGGTLAGTVGLGLVLLVAAGGMWQAKYWAVLGFEVLLGVTATFAALSLLVASSFKGALISVVVAGVAGTFFWKLIRAMARLQMPERPGARQA